VQPQFAGCDKKLRNVTSICPCKEHVTGRQCDKCKEHYYDLGSDSDKGCKACDCSRNGTLNELDSCDLSTGQCLCKHFIRSESCSECQPGTYLLQVKIC
jgi:usherin